MKADRYNLIVNVVGYHSSFALNSLTNQNVALPTCAPLATSGGSWLKPALSSTPRDTLDSVVENLQDCLDS